MRIALVNSYYAPDSIGGIETMIRALAVGSQEQGHTVRVFTTSRTSRQDMVDGVDVVRLQHRNVIWAPDVGRSWVKALAWNARSLWNPALARATARAIAAFQPDVIHVHNPAEFGPLLYWYLRRACPGVPVVQTLHGYWHTCIRQTFLGTCTSPVCAARAAYILPFTRAGVDHFLVPSESVQRAFTGTRIADRQPIEVLYNGVEFADAVPRPLRQPDAPLRVLYLGQLQRDKGVLSLLDAARALADAPVEIAVAGAGPLEHEVRATPGIHALGWLDRDGKRDAMAAADVLVFPSECEETFGLSMVEAMAEGLPVIGTAVGAVPEIIRDGINGCIVPPRDPHRLAESIRRLAQDRATLDRWSAAARSSVQQFSVHRMVAAHLARYAALAGR